MEWVFLHNFPLIIPQVKKCYLYALYCCSTRSNQKAWDIFWINDFIWKIEEDWFLVIFLATFSTLQDVEELFTCLTKIRILYKTSMMLKTNAASRCVKLAFSEITRMFGSLFHTVQRQFFRVSVKASLSEYSTKAIMHQNVRNERTIYLRKSAKRRLNLKRSWNGKFELCSGLIGMGTILLSSSSFQLYSRKILF